MLKSFSALSIASRGASLISHGKPIIAVSKIGPYSLFLKENAAKSAKITGKGSIPVFAKETAAKWKALTETEKKSYKTRAEQLNEKAMAEFRKKPESEQEKLEAAARDAKEKLAKKREKRERRENWEKTGHPKMPPNAFARFVKDKANQGAKIANMEEAAARVKKAADEWRGMSDSAKAKYVKAAEADLAQYKTDLEKWKKSNPEKITASPTKTAKKSM